MYNVCIIKALCPPPLSFLLLSTGLAAMVLEAVNRAMFEVEGGADDEKMYNPDSTTYHNFPYDIFQSQKTSKVFELGASRLWLRVLKMSCYVDLF